MITSELVSESNENLIGFIATTVEKLRDDMATMRGDMDTMRGDMAQLREQMATKEDLARLDGRLSERLETTITEMARMRQQMATKDDLARLDGRLSERLQAATTGIRGDIEQVHLRLDGIERAGSSRMDRVEGQLSRLRSAVYVLSKDRPDLLRLLGQNSG